MRGQISLSQCDVGAAILRARGSRPFRVAVWARRAMLLALGVLLSSVAIGGSAGLAAVVAAGIGVGLGVGFWSTVTYAVSFRYTTALVRAQALGGGTAAVAPLAAWGGAATGPYSGPLHAAVHHDAWHRRSADAGPPPGATATSSAAPTSGPAGEAPFTKALASVRSTPAYRSAIRRTRRLLCVTIPLALVVPLLLHIAGGALQVLDVLPGTVGLNVVLCVILAFDARTSIGFGPGTGTSRRTLPFVRQFLVDVVHREPATAAG